MAFFDHVVYGADNGYGSQAAVRYQLDGTPGGEYRGASAFPIPESTPIRLYLVSGGEDHLTHRLSASAPDGGRNSWGAIPFGATVPPRLEEVANPLLTFEALIEEPTQYAGPVALSLKFSCTEIDSHVIARRIDESRSTLTEIAIDIDARESLVPGEPVLLRFSLTPRPVLFRQGERIRLDVASRTDLLRSDLSHGYEHFEMMVPPYFSRNTLHFGSESHLELLQLVGDSSPADL